MASIKLVNGDFDPDKAKEILFSLVNNKISYHQLEIFSIGERNSGDLEPSKSRITELEESKTLISLEIEKAKEKGKKIRIVGSLQIDLLND
jgi:hypothetical protein